MSFESQIRNFEKEVIGVAEKVIKAVYIKAGNELINLTPIDTGLAKSSWFPALNGYSQDLPAGPRERSARKKEIRAIASRLKLGDYVTVTSNLKYIIPLEDGHSSQAPAGMVKIVQSLLDVWIETEAKRVK